MQVPRYCQQINSTCSRHRLPSEQPKCTSTWSAPNYDTVHCWNCRTAKVHLPLGVPQTMTQFAANTPKVQLQPGVPQTTPPRCRQIVPQTTQRKHVHPLAEQYMNQRRKRDL